MEKMKVGIFGAGYWGKNLIRVCSQSEQVELVSVCDPVQKSLDKIQVQYPQVHCTTNADDIILSSEIEVVFIATPVATHFLLAKKALENKKHVWLEKPMTMTAAEAEELVSLAKQHNRCLINDFTFLYTDSFRLIDIYIQNNELGKIRYLDSERINLGLVRQDVDVVYDLVSHDISIFLYLLHEKPFRVSAVGQSFLTANTSTPKAEVAQVNLWFPSGVITHVHASWLSPVKIRKMLIGGSKKMIVYNDIEPVEKLRVCDYGVELDLSVETTFSPIYRSGDIHIPNFKDAEALVVELEHFVSCIKSEEEPLTGGNFGLVVMKILEAIEKSMQLFGAPQEVIY